MRETGIVSKIISDNVAEVSFKGTEACLKCRACHLAEGGVMVTEALNEASAKVGDQVEIEIPVLGPSFLVFILPLIALAIGYFMGFLIFRSEVIGIFSGFLFLIFAFLILNFYDRYLKSKEKYLCRVVRISNF